MSNKVIAIFGKSCTGKSVVAKGLAADIGADVRHCGEIVKTKARELGKAPQSLSVMEHVSIDKETRSVATSNSKQVVIEGCFLDAVLHDVSGVLYVHLTCEGSERARRCVERANLRGHSSDLTARDAADATHRELLYGANTPPIETSLDVLTIDTTKMSITEVAKEVLSRLGELEP